MTAPTLPDSWALVARAQAGDKQAFADLYRQYEGNVYRFINHRIADRATVEDLAGDVWAKALRSIGGVEYQGRDFGAWLTTIARNRVTDHYKSFQVRRMTPVDDLHTWVLPALDDTEAAAANTLEGRVLVAALARLNDEQRQVVELRYLRGYTTPETAAVMGKNEGAVKALLYRAVRSLARDESVQALAVTS